MAAQRHPGRELDVVVFGATGFTGRLVAGYLAEQAPAGVHIGLAARSAERLADVRDALGPAAAQWPLIIADARDPGSIEAMVAATGLVVTTVGPYQRYGMPLVEVCARTGTHYADLTGEVLFVRDSLAGCGASAASSGARIVHSCGFDSIPSDLGVLLLFERVRDDDEGTLEDTTLVVTAMKGGVSGGTVDTMRANAEATAADPELRSVLADPYSLSPDRSSEPDVGAQGDIAWIRMHPDLGVWVGPFVMAPYNTRIVRLSNAIQGWAYGPRFRYRECMSFGTGVTAPVRAVVAGAGLAGAVVSMRFGPTRALLSRLLPAPGEGPGEDSRGRGHFRMEIRTRTSTGAAYRCVVAAQGDLYQASSVMLGESALCLALDGDRLPRRAGVLTPATAMGDALVDRLRAAGLTLTVERV